MRLINREILTNFFKQRQSSQFQCENLDQDSSKFSCDAEMQETWADENIEEEIKLLLQGFENGKFIPIDIVSHFEYFYNTLDCNF